jgi:DNA-directed RNA polymerase subunit M/transcription elongation factor TFIIS
MSETIAKRKCNGCKRVIHRRAGDTFRQYCRTCGKIRADNKAANEEAKKKVLSNKSDEDKRKLMVQASQIMLKAGDKYAEVVSICDRLMDLHGGLDGFCREWKHHIDVAARDNPGSKLILDQYHGIVRLHMKAAEHRPANTDIDQMELEDTAAELDRMATQLGLNVYGGLDEQSA